MYEDLTPPEKLARHGVFSKYAIIVTSFFGSFFFVSTLFVGSLFYHLWHKITGKERFNEPEGSNIVNGYVPRKAYPNTKKMKPSKELRYYALELGLDLEEYTLTTEDGYVLPLHRLIDPKETVLDRNVKRPILLQHGLLSCSAAWLVSGTNSLAYYLQEQGYDVWMGNNRSWFEPKHTYYKGNLNNNEKYWDWDIRSLAYYDLPTIIDHVLAHKPNHSQLSLVGHSQGCAQTFMMLKNGNLAHVHEKIDYFFPLAPAVFPGTSFHYRGFIRFIHNRGSTAYKLIFGNMSFLRNLSSIRYYLATTSFFGVISYYMFKFLFGWNARKWGKDRRVWHFCFIFNVTYVSSKLMSWWLSGYVEEGFSNQLQLKRAYKTGANYKLDVPQEHIDDSKSFFPFQERWFTETHRTVPMVIFAGGLDYLVDTPRLITHMRSFEPSYTEGDNLAVVEIADYSHVDVTWAEDVIGHIGTVIIKTLKDIHGDQHAAKAEVSAEEDEDKSPATTH